MRAFQIEVVVRAIHVSGYHDDRVESVLSPIGERLDVQQTFRQRIRGAVGLRQSIPEIRFFLRQGRAFRISAPGAGAHDFLDAVLHGVMDRQRPHHHVVVKKLPGTRLVRADAANKAGQMEHHGRLYLRVQGLNVVLLRKVPIGASYGVDVMSPVPSQPFNDVTAQEAATAGHHDPFIR